MIDTIIIGNYLGDQGLAAMSLVSPIYLIYFTFGSMLAVGASIRTSIHLGKNNLEKAEQYFGFTFYAAIVLGIIFTICGLLFLNPIVKLLGTEGILFDYAKDYCFYYICGGTITLLFYIPFNFLKIMGKPKTSMTLLITMGLLNIILTLLFVRVFHMGCGGAALSTIISLGAAFLLGCRYMFTKDANIKPRKPHLTAGEIITVISCGSASAFNNLSNAVTVILVNYIIAAIGTDLMLTIYTVSRSVKDLFLTVVLGTSQAIVPFVSLFYGEKDYLSIRTVMKYALKIGNKIILICSIVVVLFSQPLMHLFGIENTHALGMMGVVSIICVAASLNISFLNNLFSIYYSVINKVFISNVIMFSRTAMTVLCAFMLGNLFGTKVIWGWYILSEILTLAIWYLISEIYRKKNKKMSKGWLLNEESESNSQGFSFSVKNTQEDIMNASVKIIDFMEKLEGAEKQAMLVSLSLEEILILISSKCFDDNQEEYMDIRIFKDADDLLIRIRSGGKHFNPALYALEKSKENEIFSDATGMNIILNKAKKVEYCEVIGVNNLLVIL